jgi:hypothetical protein
MLGGSKLSKTKGGEEKRKCDQSEIASSLGSHGRVEPSCHIRFTRALTAFDFIYYFLRFKKILLDKKSLQLLNKVFLTLKKQVFSVFNKEFFYEISTTFALFKIAPKIDLKKKSGQNDFPDLMNIWGSKKSHSFKQDLELNLRMGFFS